MFVHSSEYGNDYVDPYVVLASLGFGVFLFNIIYNLLNRSARSVDVSDMNLVGLHPTQQFECNELNCVFDFWFDFL